MPRCSSACLPERRSAVLTRSNSRLKNISSRALNERMCTPSLPSPVAAAAFPGRIPGRPMSILLRLMSARFKE